MIITISGDLGSGKSTVGKILAEHFRIKKYSTGDFMREIALKRGVTLLELSRMAERNREVDKILDSRQIKLGQEDDNFIIDARLAWHFIPKSIKVYLKVEPEEAARRIFADTTREGSAEKENTTLKQTLENIRKRRSSEFKRYEEYYGIRYDESKNYDIIVDTTDITAQQAADRIIESIKLLQDKNF